MSESALGASVEPRCNDLIRGVLRSPGDEGPSMNTPTVIAISAIANILVVQQARELGIDISFHDFAQPGASVTVAGMASLQVWVGRAG